MGRILGLFGKHAEPAMSKILHYIASCVYFRSLNRCQEPGIQPVHITRTINLIPLQPYQCQIAQMIIILEYESSE